MLCCVSENVNKLKNAILYEFNLVKTASLYVPIKDTKTNYTVTGHSKRIYYHKTDLKRRYKLNKLYTFLSFCI